MMLDTGYWILYPRAHLDFTLLTGFRVPFTILFPVFKYGVTRHLVFSCSVFLPLPVFSKKEHAAVVSYVCSDAWQEANSTKIIRLEKEYFRQGL